MQGPEDTLWSDGRIFTGSGYVDSMLVVGGRVAALGERRPLLRQRPSGTVHRELRGRLVLPGLIDAHVHLGAAAEIAEGVDLRGVRSWEEFEDRLVSWCRLHPEGPVLGGGWDEGLLPGGLIPDRARLDRWVPDRPVLLDRICRHAAVANSAALERMGLDEDAPDPAGGKLGRGPDRILDGRLSENALALAEPVRTEGRARRAPALRRVLTEWASAGITTVGALSAHPEEVESWRAEPEPWPVRISAYLRLGAWRPGIRPVREGEIRTVGVKAHVDGALGPRTAWLRRPYTDLPTTEGMPLLEPEATIARLAEARDDGFAIALHAIGDRALEEAIRWMGRLGHPPGARIEHASITPLEGFPKLRASGAAVVVQPSFRISDRWIRERLGSERALWTYAYRQLFDAGIPLAGSSDAPVEEPDPWLGLRAATSPAPHGSAPGVLSPEEALGLYTVGAATALGRPELGALRPGGPADFVLTGVPDLAAAMRAGRRAVEGVWRDGRPIGPAAPPRR
jgi:predicted amidohydrolase YtcJ